MLRKHKNVSALSGLEWNFPSTILFSFLNATDVFLLWEKKKKKKNIFYHQLIMFEGLILGIIVWLK